MKTWTTQSGEPAPVHVKVLQPRFMVDGRPAVVDAIVTVPYHDAQRLALAGHAELVEK